MDDLSVILEKLAINTSEDGHGPSDNVAAFKDIIDSLKQNKEIIQADKTAVIVPQINSCLNITSDVNLIACLLELIAEICKFDECRKVCVDETLVQTILACLDSKELTITHQAFRAIGNLACDNDEARDMITNVGGVCKILTKLRNLQNEETGSKKVPVIVTACGAILNLSFDNEKSQKELINNGSIPLLLGYLEHNMSDQNLALMSTNAIACLLDLEKGVSSFLQNRGCEIFVEALIHSTDELTSSLVDCLKMLTEEDRVKHALVSTNCVKILHEIIETNMCSPHTDNLSEKLKLCVDLIILLLSDDKCLSEIFTKEKNVAVDKILSWNQSTYTYVRNSSPVAIGNIARTDDNCIELVKMGVHHKLMNLLRNQGTENPDQTQLQISILSALKNFAIPASNKAVLVEAGVLHDSIHFLCATDTSSPIMFRAIAVIRLLIQGQDKAVDTVCSNEDCLKLLVSLAQNSGIEGLKFEASRLLATLLKNARKSESILAIVVSKGVAPVVTMVLSSHTLMQNEALIGIALAVNVLNNEYLEEFDDMNLLEAICNVLRNENSELQTLYNSLAVVEALLLKGVIEKSKLEDCQILDTFKTLTSHSHDSIKQRAKTVLDIVKNPV